jgi:hypothetical protein
MKSAEIRAILAENPDAEFAEKPNLYVSKITRLRGLREWNGGKWAAREREREGNGWNTLSTGHLSGPPTWAPAQLLPVAEAEKILADRREEKRKSQEQAARIAGQRIARENDASAVAAQLQARGIPCTSSAAGILIQPDACRQLLELLDGSAQAVAQATAAVRDALDHATVRS